MNVSTSVCAFVFESTVNWVGQCCKMRGSDLIPVKKNHINSVLKFIQNDKRDKKTRRCWKWSFVRPKRMVLSHSSSPNLQIYVKITHLVDIWKPQKTAYFCKQTTTFFTAFGIKSTLQKRKKNTTKFRKSEKSIHSSQCLRYVCYDHFKIFAKMTIARTHNELEHRLAIEYFPVSFLLCRCEMRIIFRKIAVTMWI